MSSTGNVTITGSLSGMPTGEPSVGPFVDPLAGPVCFEEEFTALGTSPQAISVPSNAQGRMFIILQQPNSIAVTLKGSNTADTGWPLGSNWTILYIPVVPGNTYNLVAASTMAAIVTVKIV